MENNKIGFAVTGSFCTHSKIKNIISQMCTNGYDITPIVSFNTASMDSRFGKSSVFLSDIEDITKKKPIMSIQDAEMGMNFQNIGRLFNTKNIYFVPFFQDDTNKKPRSLIADFELIPQTIKAALTGRQLQPVLKCKS